MMITARAVQHAIHNGYYAATEHEGVLIAVGRMTFGKWRLMIGDELSVNKAY